MTGRVIHEHGTLISVDELNVAEVSDRVIIWVSVIRSDGILCGTTIICFLVETNELEIPEEGCSTPASSSCVMLRQLFRSKGSLCRMTTESRDPDSLPGEAGTAIIAIRAVQVWHILSTDDNRIGDLDMAAARAKRHDA